MKGETPIQLAGLKHRLSTDIDISSFPGIISEFYERSACNTANYQYETSWQDLTQKQKAAAIAHYLLDKLIDAHAEDARQESIKRST